MYCTVSTEWFIFLNTIFLELCGCIEIRDVEGMFSLLRNPVSRLKEVHEENSRKEPFLLNMEVILFLWFQIISISFSYFFLIFIIFSAIFLHFFCLISCWFSFFYYVLIEVYGSFSVDSTCWCYTVSTENLVDLSHKQSYRNLSQGNYTITLVTTQFKKFRA